MKSLILLSLLISTTAWARIGEVVKISGVADSYIARGDEKLKIKKDSDLQLNDTIHSKSSRILIYINPGIQVAVSKGAQLKLTQDLIELTRGILRVKLTPEGNSKIQTSNVTFSGTASEFEVYHLNDKLTGLEVVEGVVEASSPFVQSFVPEITKTKEGLKFERKSKTFSKTKFSPKFKSFPKFLDNKNLQTLTDKYKTK